LKFLKTTVISAYHLTSGAFDKRSWQFIVYQ